MNERMRGTDVGFVGLGVMGAPMARNVLAKGFAVAVHDADAGKAKVLADHGATAPDVAGLAEGADAIILMLPGPREVEDVVEQVATAARPGTVVIDMSTSDPLLDVELSERLAGRQMQWLDAPVSRGVPAAVKGSLLTMVGGDAEVLERCRSLLEAMCTDIMHCGPVGSGHKMKLLNELKIMSEVALLAEVVGIGTAGGLNADFIYEVLRKSSAQSFMLDYQVPRMVSGSYEPGFSIDHGHKDLTLAVRWAEHLGVALPVGHVARTMFQQAREDDKGALDTAALFEVWRERHEGGRREG